MQIDSQIDSWERRTRLHCRTFAPASRRSSRAIVVAFSTIVGAGTAAGQSVIASFGNYPYASLGNQMISIADANGDGVSDFVLSNDNGGLSGSPGSTVALVSGATGAMLHAHSHPQIPKGFGVSIADAGDLDHDGREDFACGAIQPLGTAASRVLVYSGGTGTTILEVLNPYAPSQVGFGASIAGLGDVDGDGTPDLAVANPDSVVFPLTVVSGVDGSTRYVVLSERIGSGLATIGDVDLDGTPDFTMQVDDVLDSIEVRSGSSGALLSTATSHFSSATFGAVIVAADDVNQDGVPDFAANELYISPGTYGLGGVLVESGADGSQIAALRNPFYQSLWAPMFAMRLAGGGGDVDGDGRPDLLILSPEINLPLPVWIADAATGATHATFTVGNVGTPHALAIVPDRNGDGISDIADSLGQPASSATATIHVRTLDAHSVGTVPLNCIGSGGFKPLLQGSVTSTAGGETVSIAVSSGLGGAPCAIVVSVPGLVQIPNKQCELLYVSPSIPPHVTPATLSGAGPGQGALVTAGTTAAGFGGISIQVVIADPGTANGWTMTNPIFVNG